MKLLDAADRPPVPETRPDSTAGEHRILCKCEVCKRPQAAAWKKRAQYLMRVAATAESG